MGAGMQGIKKSILLFCLSALSACAKVNSVQPFDQEQAAILLQQHYVAKPTQQMIAIALPKGQRWKKIDESRGTIGTPLMLLPANESESSWRESIRTKISGYLNTPQVTPRQFMENEITAAKENCQHVNATELSQQAESLVYSISISGCEHGRDEKQIAKAFKGKDAVYFICYTAISSQVSQKQFNELSQAIKQARLVNRSSSTSTTRRA
jgi:hypothetical protein